MNDKYQKFDERLMQEMEERTEFLTCAKCTLGIATAAAGGVAIGFGQAWGSALIGVGLSTAYAAC